MVLLTHEDIAPLVGSDPDWATINIYIADVWAQAVAEAPCLASESLDLVSAAAAKAILRQAVLRWIKAGEGNVTTDQQTAGPFSHTLTIDRSAKGEGRLFDAEIRRLQKLCPAVRAGRKAFSIMPRLG